MAVKTRTPRQSSGINKTRKEVRAAAQDIRQEKNLSALAEFPGGSHFLQNAKGERVRPSKALRKAERAKRFASVTKS